MKKRLTGKPAAIVIFAILSAISLSEIILRGVLLRGESLDITNAGEPIITVLLSLMLLIFAVKGKDRLLYICTGGFLFYFVLKQLFGLPEMFATFASMIKDPDAITPAMISILIRAISMLFIVAIGVLVVKYVNDGSICNRAFNIFCIITVSINLAHSLMLTGAIIAVDFRPLILALLNSLSYSIMVFLFAFFTYDSAKEQIAKTKLEK